MPDRLEIAASGRARCRACRKPIDKGDERFAEAAPNPVAEGESQHYYHLICAAERRPRTFSALLATLDSPRPELQRLRDVAELALRHHRLERLGVLERSKSARASCRHCREPIDKGSWRVALQPIEDGRLAAWGFLHLACAGSYTGIKPDLERLARYTELAPEERTEIAALLHAMPQPEPRPPNEDTQEGAPLPDAPDSHPRPPEPSGAA